MLNRHEKTFVSRLIYLVNAQDQIIDPQKIDAYLKPKLSALIKTKFEVGLNALNEQIKDLEQKDYKPHIYGVAEHFFEANQSCIIDLKKKICQETFEENLEAYYQSIEFQTPESLQIGEPESEIETPRAVAVDIEYLQKIKHLRRLDSLSRLFSLSSEYSVCTAVTFFPNQFVISCNINRKQNPQQLVDFIVQRYIKLKEVIKHIQSEGISIIQAGEPNETSHFPVQFITQEFKLIFNDFYQQCANNGGFFQPERIFFQAFFKIISSFCMNDGGLSPKEIDDFLHKDIQIIMATKGQESDPHLGINLFKNNELERFMPLEDQHQTHEVHQFHAEQMILYVYAQNHAEALSSNTKIEVGVSKYACATCHHAISPFATIRGHVANEFKNTATLISPEKPLEPIFQTPDRTPKKNYAEESPIETPLTTSTQRKSPLTLKDLRFPEEIDRTTSLLCDRFFSSAETEESLLTSPERQSECTQPLTK